MLGTSNLTIVRFNQSLLVWTSRLGTGTGNPPDDGWSAWDVPRTASMLKITCVGGGGGGAGGGSGAAGTSRTGGAGGASGGVARLTIPTLFLPRRLFLWPGAAGQGDIATSDGERGLKSCVTDKPYRTVNVLADTILQSGSDSGTSGGGAFGGNPGGTTQASGVSGETTAAATCGAYVGLGIFTSKSGVASGSGGNVNAAGGNNSNAWGTSSGIPFGGGAGGGSVSTGDVAFDGGISVGGGKVPSTSGGVAGVIGGEGLPGVKLISNPFASTGGSGGGGGTTLGGKGGKGGWGSGGGGGGGGTTGGAGGDGGPGFILLEWW